MRLGNISQTILKRLPVYLNYLKSLPGEGPANISATTIATVLNMGEVQVRKDLASVCGGGKPKIGYVTSELIDALEIFLGYRDMDNAIIVGAGKLGCALLDYGGFEEYGMHIIAAFDTDEKNVVGQSASGKQILPLFKLGELCRRIKVKIGIITVPSEQAQAVCDMMTENGILAVMNFASVNLKAPDDVILQNENIASSLALLSKKLTKSL